MLAFDLSHRRRAMFMAFIAAAAAGVADAAVVRYRAVLLDPLNGGPVSEALAINATGVVAGSAGSGAVNPGQHAVIWSTEQVQNLDPMFNLSAAQVINASGVVAGGGWFCPPMTGPCVGVIARALPGGQFVPVGTLGGGNGEVLDINAAGAFVGWWYDDTFNQRAFVHSEADGVQDLSTLVGFAGSGSANAINDRGAVVGSIRDSAFQQRAFVWQDGVMTDLGTLGGDASAAQDINTDGVIVGWARDAAGMPRAFRSGDARTMQDIPSLPGALWSSADVINDAGMIGGTWYDGKEDRLFVFTDSTGMIDIGEPVPDFHPVSGPRDINAQGRMVGVGTTNMYQPLAWFWSSESGIRSLNDLVAGGDAIDIQAVGGINQAGQIAVSGTLPGTFNQRAARLDPVAPADLNADAQVNIDDLLALIALWGSDDVVADIDGDGVVEIDDLLTLIAAWG